MRTFLAEQDSLIARSLYANSAEVTGIATGNVFPATSTAYSLTLDVGAHVLTGNAVALRRGYTAVLFAGTYTATGQPVALTFSGSSGGDAPVGRAPFYTPVTENNIVRLSAGAGWYAPATADNQVQLSRRAGWRFM